MANKNLLIVVHAPSPNTEKLLNAIVSGAADTETNGLEINHRSPFQTGADDVLAADALILGTTENLGYMSGALKDFFDRIYYPCLEKTQGLPYALYIRAGMDGTGTQRSVEAIVSGLRWRAVQDPLICRGEYKASFQEQCRTLGMAMAIGLDAGIF